MLLGGGTLMGTRILDRSSVREAFTNQIGDLWVPAEIPTADPTWSCGFSLGAGSKWGWGLKLNTIEESGTRAAGSGAWAGIFNTYFWVDPAHQVTGAMYTQCLPFVHPDVLRVYADFERALYTSPRPLLVR
jgi:CubicO group peptidase (beta-lactamase class C family)